MANSAEALRQRFLCRILGLILLLLCVEKDGHAGWGARKVRVLMLGWEFPPYLTGGLGQASYELFRALAPEVEMVLVLPQWTPIAPADTRTIGLSQFSPDQRAQLAARYDLEAFVQYYRIATDLLPYPVPRPVRAPHRALSGVLPVPVTRSLSDVQRLFQDDMTYGPHLSEKVSTYAEAVRKIAATQSFDLIHAHDWLTFAAAEKVKADTGKPLVVQVHSLETDRADGPPHPLIAAIEQRAVAAAERVIVPSHYTQSQLAAHYAVPPEKVTVLHHATTLAGPPREPSRLPGPLVAFLGRVTYQKGPDTLLDVAARLLPTHPDLKFVVMGTGDAWAATIEKAATRRLGAHFIFTGFLARPQVQQVLAQTHVLLMPSVSEPFGLAALEAAQMGAACVLSDRCGAAEVLPGALVAPPDRPDLLADHVARLLDDEPYRQQLVAQNLEAVQALTWHTPAHATAKLYRQLLDDAHAPTDRLLAD